MKLLTLSMLFLCNVYSIWGQGDGMLLKNGKRLFPIGWYSMPQDMARLKEMADAGINIVGCRSRESLDLAAAVGIQGWMRMPLEKGVTEDFKKRVLSVAGHPALAVWEGPDELVHNFTAYSGLKVAGSWENQSPERLEYAREKSAKIMPGIAQSIAYIRSVDPNNLQFWFNEAAGSDPFYVHQYIQNVDITGCDIYPISTTRKLERPGFFTERWKEIGKGKPVWMVLQAFSWHELSESGGKYLKNAPAYPSFEESRFMAYDVIAHGASGILYWGANHLTSEDCRQSLFSLTSELSMLQQFLTASEQKQVNCFAIKEMEPKVQPVAWIARQFGRDWMIVLINENDFPLKGIEVMGLTHLNGLKLLENYGDEILTVENEGFTTRLMPHQVKVFTTGKKWESSRINGRGYPGK